MPWNFSWSDFIKKRACRYLLNHYLGQFLEEKLTLDQLSVDLYNGTGVIKELALDVASLNEALGTLSVPVEIVDGFVGSIVVSIPWSALIYDSTTLEVDGLELTLQPKQREQNGTGLEEMFSSMCSMTTSLQLAEEVLKHDSSSQSDQYAESAQKYEGVEMFAQTIDSVLSRVKVTFLNTTIRMEHLAKDTDIGVALEIRIKRLEYYDDMALSSQSGSSVDEPARWEPAAFAHKNLKIMGVSFYSDQFSRHTRPSTTKNLSQPTGQEPSSPVTPLSSISPENYMLRAPSYGGTDPKASPIQSDPIKLAILTGQQELKVKIKQNEALQGPKLEMDFHLGALHIILCPRQIHLLLDLFNGITLPASSDHSCRKQPTSISKPMLAEDYQRVESELQRHLQEGRITGHQGHISPPMFSQPGEMLIQHSLNDSDDEVYFSMATPLKSSHDVMESSYSSVSTNYSNSTTSTAAAPHGSCISGNRGVNSGRKTSPGISAELRDHTQSRSRFYEDTSAELTHYKIKLSFFSLTLLHENPVMFPLASPTTTDPSLTAPCFNIKDLAETFFLKVPGIGTSGTTLQISDIRKQYSQACQLDHIGCLCKHVTLECTQKTSRSKRNTSLDVCVSTMEVVEALYSRSNQGSTSGSNSEVRESSCNIRPDYSELLVFPSDGAASKQQHMFTSTYSARPCLRLRLDTAEYQKKSPSSRSPPKTHMNIDLAQFQCEVDITLVDRVHALLHPENSAHRSNGSSGQKLYASSYNTHSLTGQQYFTQALDEEPLDDRDVNISVTAPIAQLFCRFPVPILGTVPQFESMPWWKRHLRTEILILTLHEFTFNTMLQNNSTIEQLEFLCREAHGQLLEQPDVPPTSFLYVSCEMDSETESELETGFNWARLLIKMFNKKVSVLEDTATSAAGASSESDDQTTPSDSLNGACQFVRPEPSPFSAKKHMYEKEEVVDKSEVKHTSEELVLPGDREEMLDFQEKALSSTKMSIDISLPCVLIRLPSKPFLELIYNRICNDLLLWESRAPSPLLTDLSYVSQYGHHFPLDIASQLLHGDQFQICKSALVYDSDSDSDDMNPLYSIHDSHHHKRRKSERHLPSELCLSLNIGSGKLHAFTPVLTLDGSTSSLVCGEFAVTLQEGNLFAVVAHKGDPDLQMLCIEAGKAEVYHNGSVDIPAKWPVLGRDEFFSPVHSELTPTIYQSEESVSQVFTHPGVKRSENGVGMLAAAIKIKFDPVKNMKEFVVSLGVQNATLRHKMTQDGYSWISQLVDLVSLLEFPIQGYIEPQVLTELHVHMWNCAVDYRPLHIPLRAMLTVQGFSVSSNIVTEAPISLLRFLIDDATLFLSDKPDAHKVDLKQNYVSVVDMERFELSLITCDKQTQKSPKLDMRAGTNKVNVRTCSDSAKALMELIRYFADDGDLSGVAMNQSDCSLSSQDTFGRTVSDSRADESLYSSSAESDIILSHSTMEHVHDSLADAMKESSLEQQADTVDSQQHPSMPHQATQVFFLPDGTSPDRCPVSAGTLLARHQIVISDSVDSISSTESSDRPIESYGSDGSDGFCIIDDPGLGIASKDGEPRIRNFIDAPIQIQENYFSQPLSRSDLLKPPDNFPAPVYRYTLKEMTITCHMYGGHDFGHRLLDGARRSGKPVSSHGTDAKTQADRDRRKQAWLYQGGVRRDMNVLMEVQLYKVQFQHEVYPEHTEEASRRILLINDIEIRDRLASSKINKFLYQYASEARPKQSHANMVLVKAVNFRTNPVVSSAVEECSLRISLLPIRLNIDQDALMFLRKFFIEIMGAKAESRGTSPRPESQTSTGPAGKRSRKASGSQAPAPVMCVGDMMDLTNEIDSSSPGGVGVKFDEMSSCDEGSESDRLQLLLDLDSPVQDSPLTDDVSLAEDTDTVSGDSDTSLTEQQPVFFRSFIFSPEVPIRLDYHGKRVDTQQGTLAGLLAGLAQLNCSELKLKRVNYRHGLLGTDRLIAYAVNDWLSDIKKNQLPSILGGVGPMHSFVQIVQGIRDLFWLPVEQYRKDGRIVRGIQRGATSFTTSTAIAILELTNRVVQLVQVFAELTYDMVSPGPSVRHQQTQYQQLQNKIRRTLQPADLREGVANAYVVIKEGITGTAQNIARVAAHEHEQKGLTGAVGGVLRQIPPTIIQPVIIASAATSNVLGGMRNQLRPDARREDEEKWRNLDEL